MIRRWIRLDRMHARKIGTQHVIEEGDPTVVLESDESLPLPSRWRTTASGRAMPDVVRAIRRSRRGH